MRLNASLAQYRKRVCSFPSSCMPSPGGVDAALPWLGIHKSISHGRNGLTASEFEMGRGGEGGGEGLLLFTFVLYLAAVSEGDAASASSDRS